LAKLCPKSVNLVTELSQTITRPRMQIHTLTCKGLLREHM
jgi:hypothetical protein